jgi:hypothetical protein
MRINMFHDETIGFTFISCFNAFDWYNIQNQHVW